MKDAMNKKVKYYWNAAIGMHFIFKIERRGRDREGWNTSAPWTETQRYIGFESLSTMERDIECETISTAVIQLLLLFTPLVTV